jgi:erythromycin esterase
MPRPQRIGASQRFPTGRVRWPSGPLQFSQRAADGWASRPYPGRRIVKKLFAFGISLIALCLSNLAPAATEPAAREAWIEFFRETAYPLESPADLGPLLDAARGKKLVLLGESTHGTKEFYDWRFAISKRLIEEQNFNFIGVEGDWEALYALNRYVKDMPGAAASAREVLTGLDRWPEWMWGNESVVALAEWLRTHNEGRPPGARVGFYGVDVYSWDESVRRLPDFLEQLEPGWGDEARRELQPLLDIDGDMEKFREKIIMGGPGTAPQIHAIIERLRTDREKFIARDAETYLRARQSAKLIRQAKLHIRGSVDGTRDGWNQRAVNFVDACVRLFDHYGEDARGILWAHNTHIGDARHTPAGPMGMLNSGQLARQRLGEDNVLLVGFATRTGDLLAGSAWGSARQTMTMPPAPAESFEAWMHEAGLRNALLIFHTARDRELLLHPGVQRAIGVVYNPRDDRGHYVPTILPLRYDALIYLDETSALEAL